MRITLAGEIISQPNKNMAYSYNTTTKQITVTATSTVRAMYDDIQTTFAGSSFMQYPIPMSGSIKDGLYILANSWVLASGSLGYLTTGGLIDTAIANRWTNVQTISGDSFTGIQLYYNQTGTPTNFAVTGLVNLLLPVRASGSDINSQMYTVYQRTFGRAYSQFSVTASAGGIDTVPLSNQADSQISLSQATVDAYSDLTIKWATIYRSAFDGASTTKYTLNGAHTNSVTTITVNESVDASVPSSGTLQIGSEVISYTGKTTHTFTGCTRGQYYTTAASYVTLAALSTNMAAYGKLIQTTNSARRLSEAYQWHQSRLTKSTDIDALSGGHVGQLTPSLLSYTGTMLTAQGVWIEGYSLTDANSISFTDNSGTVHAPPLTVNVGVTIDSSVVGAQVQVVSLNTTGLTEATYTPSNIAGTIINQTSSGTTNAVSVVYTADTPVRVSCRKPGYQQFVLFTTIVSTGLAVTAQNPVDGTY